MTAQKKRTRARAPESQPLQIRAAPEFLQALDELREELLRVGHPVADARGIRGLTRTDVVRLLIARGERVVREEVQRLRGGAA